MRSKLISFGVFAVVSACSASEEAISTTANIVSGFNNNAVLENETLAVVVNDVGRVDAEVGYDATNDVYVGRAGIEPNPQVGNAITSNATYNGEYEFLYLDNLDTTTVISDRETGNISIDINFATGAVTGSSADMVTLPDNSMISEFEIDGTITSGTQMSGDVIVGYEDAVVSGTVTTILLGEVGEDGLIGAFHGSDTNTVIAGGVVAE